MSSPSSPSSNDVPVPASSTDPALALLLDTRAELRAMRESADKKKDDPWWTKAAGMLGIPVVIVALMIQFNQFRRESAPINSDKQVAEVSKLQAERDKTLAEAEKLRMEIQDQRSKGTLATPALLDQTVDILKQLSAIAKKPPAAASRAVEMGALAAIGLFLVLFLNRCFGLFEDVSRMLFGAALNYVLMIFQRRLTRNRHQNELETAELSKKARDATDRNASAALYKEIESRTESSLTGQRRLSRAIERVGAIRILIMDAIHTIFLAVGVLSVFVIYGRVFDELAIRSANATRASDIVRMVATVKWPRAFHAASAVLAGDGLETPPPVHASRSASIDDSF